MTNFEIHNLWPVPIYETKVDMKVSWLKLAEKENYMQVNSKSAHYTKDSFILNKLPDLKKQIEKHCKEYVTNVLCVTKTLKFELTNSWINRYIDGEFYGTHFHQNCLISGVYYMKTVEGTGEISFSPTLAQTNLFYPNLHIDFSQSNKYNCKKFFVQPTEGTLLLFPSLLHHSVLQNNSINPKYSLGFNFFPKGKFHPDGDSKFQLEIK